MFRFFFSFVSILLLLASFAPAPSYAQQVNEIKILKSERVMKLLHDGKVLKEYRFALGGSPKGAKTCEGDEKTPEGVYTIRGRNINSRFHRSLRVSYPNAEDRKRSKERRCASGGDIMIHGLPNGSEWLGASHRARDWTLGCIAVTNDEVEEIWRLVEDGTRVLIVP